MKKLTMFVFATAFLTFTSAGLYAQSGIVHMSDFPKITTSPTPDPDDTARIRRAIAAVVSGTVVFDEQQIYYVSDTIDLNSYLTLQGSSFNTLLGYPNSPSHIRLTASNKPLFRIYARFSISLRDLGLSAASAVGTVGFQAEGDATHSIQFVEFRNVQFDGFHYGIAGIDIQSGGPSNWQFDNVKVEHSHFIVPATSGTDPTLSQRHAAVFVDSANSGWRIYSSNITVGQQSMGLHFKRVAYSDIDSMVTQAVLPQPSPTPTPPPGPLDLDELAHSAIYVENHGSLKISNSVSEGVYYDLLVNPPAPVAFPINLISNTFQGHVELSGSTVNSIGNQFGLIQPWEGHTPPWFSSPMPVVKAHSVVYSMGDRFCTSEPLPNPPDPGGEWECEREWVKDGGSRSLTFGAKNNKFEFPSLFKNYGVVSFPIDPSDNGAHVNRPMFSIIAETGATRPLLRLGFKYSPWEYHYELQRNGTTGYLEFVGNQSDPNKGYSFNGPVQLPTYTVSTLPTPQGSGALSFCSDCTTNSSPCNGSGGGALAMSIGSIWVCK